MLLFLSLNFIFTSMEGQKNRISKAEKIYKSILLTAKYYISELDYYGNHQFKQKITEKDWTIGQLYDHLVNGTYNNHLKQIENCMLRVHGAEGGGKSFKGKMLFLMGSYPKLRLKGPGENEYIPSQPEDPVKMKDSFFKFMKVVLKVSKDIETTKLDYKTKHGTFGMLNALEWLKLIEMHFRHHLRQKRRLDKTLRSSYKAIPGEEMYYSEV